ncbi:MAG: GNAT family N-acetyltransferase [Clostridiales bacterium]|jgi:GNAT superfamily N-acetyltransferase|nr:GNAT family N-acetyltransferase [Clostridiales bacterium]
MVIKKYDTTIESLLFDMLADEGDDWREYYGAKGREKYRKALGSSIAYVAFDGEHACGYIRCREDDGFGVYVYDLLVRRTHRGMSIGAALMDQVRRDFPCQPVYVMSDVDPYYEKLGYRRVGSIFLAV